MTHGPKLVETCRYDLRICVLTPRLEHHIPAPAFPRLRVAFRYRHFGNSLQTLLLHPCSSSPPTMMSRGPCGIPVIIGRQ